MSSELPSYVEERSPILTLSRGITVRPLYHADAEIYGPICNKREISRNMRHTWPDPYTVESSHEWITMTHDQSSWQPIGPAPTTGKDERIKLPINWCIAQDDVPVGGIGFKFENGIHERQIEIGYWISVDHWGKGIASEVLQAIVPWVWENYPHIIRMEACHYGWNPASGRVLKKAGFTLEGTHKAKVVRYGEVCDLMIYGLVREEFVR